MARNFLLVLTTGLLFGFMMPTSTLEKDMKSLETLTEGSNKFAISLYQALSKNSSENVIVSPASIQLVLSWAFMGAVGDTANEIKALLKLPDNQDDILKGNKQLIEGLRNPVLKIANKMFVEKSLNIKEEFQSISKNFFLSTTDGVNFKEEPEESRKQINKWVEDNTNNKIKDLLAEGVIDSLSRLVLVNAIHFKAKWQNTFDPELTRDEPFYLTPTQTVTVKMMHIKTKFGFRHHPELKAKFLEMPYKDGEFKMVIILPDEKDGLPEVENKLQTLNLVEEFSKLSKETVNVALPKFKIEKTMDLNEILKSMGVKSMFLNADFSGITEDEPLQVSKVIQKAFIEVNEEGTEAAAATAMGMRRKRELDPNAFVADHPFGLVIIHSYTGSIVFAVRVASIPLPHEPFHEEL